jgi:fibro-slime domain-containing protein
MVHSRPSELRSNGTSSRGLRLSGAIPSAATLFLMIAACNNSPDISVGGTGTGGQPGGGGSAGGTGATSGRNGSSIIIPDAATTDAPPASHCGDGILDQNEQCDDGNSESGDGCSRICQVENNFECPTPGKPCVNQAKCGNGLLTSDETCDDGNTLGNDGCSADCKTVEPGWQCRVPGKPCTSKCGDGIVSGSESCDDGNTKSGDGCSATCQREIGFKCDNNGNPSKCLKTTCGDNNREEGEGCDDGNTMPFDGCSEECQWEPKCVGNAPCTSTCGDGIMLGENEACDDGNAASGDGCSKDCKVEAGWTCKQPELGDKMVVPAIFRDFKMHHPSDFEPDDDTGCSGTCAGMVKDDLDTDGKPVFTGVTTQGVDVESADTFKQWYRSTSGVNHANASKLALWKVASGAYVNRYGANGEQWKNGVDGNPLFFPVDGDSFSSAELTGAQIPAMYDPSVSWDLDNGGNQRKHNFSFTSEVRYWFKYDASKSYKLDFVGDDDFWVFVNKKLAVDLGGLHSAQTGSVTIDTAAATKLGSMKSGNVYEVAVFHAERHTTASSFKLTLNGFNAAATICTPTCGDGVAVADEECDSGKDNSDTAYGGCTTKCKWGPFCGDGIVNGTEECDNGKNNGTAYGTQGCTLGCTKPHFCGDGNVDTDRNEECDMADKNGVKLDRDHKPSTAADAQVYCTTDCKIPPAILL